MNQEQRERKPVNNILTLSQVAERLNLNVETARRWAVAGRIPAFRYNDCGRWHAFEEDVQKFLDAHRLKAASGQAQV
ncbi:helix-turn-helix domain-containing protein [Massilia sp. PWRC2]|uniref:helix-turn-helix domain-containing protein n=1 Tax=Massilia sp. PWRC2 TaxID=2804626 RepID=UPI003CEFABAA